MVLERRGRPGAAAVAARGGAPVLAVVVGASQGRGARALLSRRSRAASRMRASLQGVSLPGEDRVLGLVAFAGWKIVDSAASDACAFTLMQALADWHRKSAKWVRFAEHRVMSSCVLQGRCRLCHHCGGTATRERLGVACSWS